MVSLNGIEERGKPKPGTDRVGRFVDRFAPDGGLTTGGLALLLFVHIVVWTIAATIAQSSGGLHHDMTEAYDWGREFQLGYAKHPPFFAWVAGAWFRVFPRTDWAYYLLSAVNAAGGLTGIWCLAGRLMPARAQTAALLLTMLTPFFSVTAINFNANAILLLMWPWTVWAFVRSMQTVSLGDGLAFGVIAGLAMMSKYTSVLLLLACLGASLAHARRAAYFASAAPYAAIAACAAVCLPHAIWVLTHHLTTVNYVLEKPHRPPLDLLRIAATSFVGALAMFALPFGASVASTGWVQTWTGLRDLAARVVLGEQRWLTVLALGPFLLTCIFGLAAGLKLSTNYLQPALLIWPTAAMAFGFPDPARVRLADLARVVAGWLAFAVLAAPLVATGAFALQTPLANEPSHEVAAKATQLWHDAFGTKLRHVTGSVLYALATPFYSPDGPGLYLMATPADSPWVSQADIARDGLLIICEAADGECTHAAARLSVPGTLIRPLRIERTFLGLTAPPRDFQLYLLPPAS